MGAPFFGVYFEPTAQADIGIVSGHQVQPQLSPIGPLSFGFLWAEIWSSCGATITTNYSVCGATITTGWTNCAIGVTTSWGDC